MYEIKSKIKMYANSEVFRFALIRPPKTVSPEDSIIKPILLQELVVGTHSFIGVLRHLRLNGDRDAMLQLATDFKKSSEFIDSPQKFNEVAHNEIRKYVELAFVVRDNINKPNNSYFEDNFNRLFAPHDASTVLNSPEYSLLFTLVSKTIITSSIVPNISSTTKSFNAFLIYALDLIKQLATNSLSSEKINDSTIILPRDIFPLPPVKTTLVERYKKEQERRRKIFDEQRIKHEEISKLLDANNDAITELIYIFQKIDDNERKKCRGFVLSRDISNKISGKTKKVLQNYGLLSDEVDVAKCVSILEKSNSKAVSNASGNIGAGTRLTKIGSVLLPANYFASEELPTGNQRSIRRIAGVYPSPYLAEANGPTGEPTTPAGYGQAHAYGFSDLMVVEQNLSHYEYGEIAHIENVMKSEIRERELKTTRTHEESELIETEETSEKTEDLTTAERYELGTESQKVINENSSTQVGVTVNASYGPSVDVTGNFNYSNSTSTQDSKSASSNFARETTNRTINRIEKRKLTRRFVRNVEEVVDLNKHIFENQNPDAENISGIYRWVDKIYSLQIVNYGKRFMLEFIVPEPAAFLRHCASQLPSEDTEIVKPDPPGKDVDGTFYPLLVEDIQRADYTTWIGKYNVQDISPPPPEFAVVSQSKKLFDEIKKSNQADKYFGVEEGFVTVPDGYIPISADINLRGEAHATTGDIWVQVQGQEATFSAGPVTVNLYNPSAEGLVVGSVPYTIDTKEYHDCAVIINVFLILSHQKFDAWQISTFTSIMNAYNDLKSRYDDEVKVIKIRAGYSEIKGKNPFYNRELEKLELKRGCISILTGQNFDLFDAVKKNVPPYGYPEIVDFNEALVDGEYIRRFEQAFEWQNMTYLFYPYFWGNKEDWIRLSKIDDADPLFARFLQSGSARVLVPVRPGFEKTIIEYLHLEDEWNAEGTVIPEGNEVDPFNISIIDEIKGQTGNNSLDGKGTVNVTQNSTHITGTDTEFNANDENRRIIIKGKTYVIKTVSNETEIDLTANYTDSDEIDIIYSLGGILVGQPWQVKLPTSLVKLDSNIQIR